MACLSVCLDTSYKRLEKEFQAQSLRPSPLTLPAGPGGGWSDILQGFSFSSTMEEKPATV